MYNENPEYAGTPLEPSLPKCKNNQDWAISRENYNIFVSKYTKSIITDENTIIALNDYPVKEQG